MNENYFVELNAINVSEKVEKKNGLSYLSWAYAWGELKKRYPKANYKIYERENGCIYWTDEKTCWVKVGVTIDEIEHIEYLPVMNNVNKSIPKENVTSFDVNKAIQRALTKAIARHGLGLYIYAGEDLPEDEQCEQAQKEAVNEPTKEHLEELRTLGGTIQIVAQYYKVEVEEVSGEMVQRMINLKKRSIAKEQAKKSEVQDANK